ELPRVREIVVAYHALAERLGVKAETAPPPTTAEPTAEPTTIATAAEAMKTTKAAVQTTQPSPKIKLDDYFVAFKGEWGRWEYGEGDERWVQTTASAENAWYRLFYVERPPLWPAVDDEPSYSFYYGWGAYFKVPPEKLFEIVSAHDSGYLNEDGPLRNDSLSWTNANITFFGLHPGQTITEAKKIVQQVFGATIQDAWGEVADDYVCELHINGIMQQIDDTSFILGFNMKNGKIAEIIFCCGYLIG
ncbi:MAG: hypothetical protein LBJ11_11245, partial [Oscillospiraceae bacterium]|nr:hypothetical protein [Oscillospiraceae bacterium]